jgi:uncharacterized SAM-binding protein YcdF (DUF218 family)
MRGGYGRARRCRGESSRATDPGTKPSVPVFPGYFIAMLLVISKLVPALLFPAGLAILLCLLAAWLAFRKGAPGGGSVALAAALLLYTAASPILSEKLLRGLESQSPPPRDYPQAAAVVLLGGGMAPLLPPRVHPETNAAGDRLLHAARLWKRGRAPVVVATGGYIPFLTTATGSEADLYAVVLTELFGLPEAAILRVPQSRTTHEDALYAAELFTRIGMKKDILLVTSATHMRRAAAIFHKQGFTVHAAPTDFRASEKKSFKAFDLLPSGAALAETHVALSEYVGYFAYRLLGRL